MFLLVFPQIDCGNEIDLYERDSINFPFFFAGENPVFDKVAMVISNSLLKAGPRESSSPRNLMFSAMPNSETLIKKLKFFLLVIKLLQLLSVIRIFLNSSKFIWAFFEFSMIVLFSGEVSQTFPENLDLIFSYIVPLLLVSTND